MLKTRKIGDEDSDDTSRGSERNNLISAREKRQKNDLMPRRKQSDNFEVGIFSGDREMLGMV